MGDLCSYVLGPASRTSSALASSSLAMTECLEIPSSQAISVSVKPSVIREPICRSVASVRSESIPHGISIELVVDTDKRGELPFVDSPSFEFPDRSAFSLPDPIIGAEPEDRSRVAREADAALPRVELERELPGGDEELLLEVLAVGPAELEAGTGDDRGAERGRVVNVP